MFLPVGIIPESWLGPRSHHKYIGLAILASDMQW